MAKKLDFEWLKSQAANEKEKNRISKIESWRHLVLETNQFIESDELFSLHLGKYHLWFRESSSYFSVETYEEIFKDNNHFLDPQFSGKDAKVIFDIGANEGFYSLKIKETNPQCQIIAAEPNPYAFDLLKKNVQENRLSNILLINKAVGPDNSGTHLAVIRQMSAISGCDLRIQKRPWLKDEFIEKLRVPTVTLESLSQENHISHVDILKVDVEGMELEIFEKSQDFLNMVDKIVVEWHGKKVRDNLIDLLMKNHFHMVLEEEGPKDKNYGDLYFIRHDNIG